MLKRVPIALSERDRSRLAEYRDLLMRFNQKHNLISHAAEAHIEEHHLPHCLALAQRSFPPRSAVVDWGTGGGLPAIPLAIVFPEITMYAVDAVEKKVRAVRAMARRLGLDNLFVWHGRAEQWAGVAHYSVSRATAPLADLWRWHTRIAEPLSAASEEAWLPGLISPKGGDLRAEIEALRREDAKVEVEQIPLSLQFDDPYFADKYVVTVRKGEDV